MKISRDTVERWIKPAVSEEVYVQGSGGRNPKTYTPGIRDEARKRGLPSVKELAQVFPPRAPFSTVNPIDGSYFHLVTEE